MLEAIELAHSEIKKIVAKIEELRGLAGKPKRVITQEPIDAALTAQVRGFVAGPIREAILIPNKSARQERLDRSWRRRSRNSRVTMSNEPAM